VEVAVSRVPDAGERAQLEPEDLGLDCVAPGAAEADHRVRLVRLESLAARQPAELVRAEVDRAIGDRPRREAVRESLQRGRHPLHELVAAALLEQQPRMHASERLEDHQLCPQQDDAVHLERRGAHHLRRLGEVHEQPRGGDRRGGGCRRGLDGLAHRDLGSAFTDDAVRRVDRHELCIAQQLGRLARPHDAGDSELS